MSDSDDLKRRARELCEAGRHPLWMTISEMERRKLDRWGKAMALLPALLARIEALEVERDEARTFNAMHEHIDSKFMDEIKQLRSERDALRARVKTLDVALDGTQRAYDAEYAEACDADDLRARLAKYERVVAAIGELLSANGCDCNDCEPGCSCNSETADACRLEPCLAHRIGAALDALDPKEAT